METININNNIALHYIEMKKLKTNVAGIYIRRPLTKQEAAKNAVLSYVLKNGCKKYPSTAQISKELQNLYGATLNSGVLKNGGNQVIFFDAETIADRYAPNSEKLTLGLISLLMSVIFEPLTDDKGFAKDIVMREKTTVKNKIDAMINDKRTYAQHRCAEEMCRGDAFALSKFGTKDEVNEIDENNLLGHYNDIITTSQIDIFICGETNIKETSEEIRRYTQKLTFKPYSYSKPAAFNSDDDKQNITDRLDVTQGKLSIGFTTGICASDSEYPAMVVANSIFGAGTHSKLFNNVREKLSLAYYASSTLNKYKGLMFVNAGIEFDKFDDAYNETIAQLEALKNGKISDDELNFSKSTIINSLNSYYDDQRYMQMYALDCLYLGISCDIEAYKQSIQKVTISDVIKVSSKIKENTVYFLAGKAKTEKE